jgi:hypothetical protein
MKIVMWALGAFVVSWIFHPPLFRKKSWFDGFWGGLFTAIIVLIAGLVLNLIGLVFNL